MKTESEMMINSRPLAYIGLENGSLETLTPKKEVPLEVLKLEWKRQQLITAMFWKSFITEYKTELYLSRVGDVVAIVDTKIPGSWLGRIINVQSSKDGSERQN